MHSPSYPSSTPSLLWDLNWRVTWSFRPHVWNWLCFPLYRDWEHLLLRHHSLSLPSLALCHQDPHQSAAWEVCFWSHPFDGSSPSAYMSLFLPSFYLFSLYIYTYPSILDCPDIPYDYLLPLFAQFYRLLPPNPQVPLVYQHKTNRSLGPYCHQENDIFDETTNLHKIDIRSSSYIQSVASSLPTELVELIGVNHFQHMIVFCT